MKNNTKPQIHTIKKKEKRETNGKCFSQQQQQTSGKQTTI